MELFHFSTGGPLIINYAPEVFFSNLERIKDLILNKHFVPFPPRPSTSPLFATNNNEYPSRDGYENDPQFNLIARAILIHPELVHMWKKIGYTDICVDYNKLVIKGALLILFPPRKPNRWNFPGIKLIIDRLQQLTSLGFKLDDEVMKEVIKTFENNNDEITIILQAINIIRDAMIRPRQSKT